MTVEDHKQLADKLEPREKARIRDAIEIKEKWLEIQEEETKDRDYVLQLQQIKKICEPIVEKVYRRFGGRKTE